ncbi:ABC transporter ATP-binding protein [Lactobacillus psittaci]|uniref:ATP-binding transport protein natA ABC transporter n=1 Tax=Lactobacillus psittaci DSM 15354 TaxID=1122152 RepID=A0A0R1S2V2_9LACO|nr:ATP-binding cassette domain-containing protein [Lactobacillus psittaci]KRL61924.1 ATP-binding transport protein natA ABC transporter [Lactobacillus psittaci DSM 15354]
MIISAKDIVKRYRKIESKGLFKKKYHEVLAVNNINLDIKLNEHIGLVGLNGSGKSTLIKMILGILKPSQGEITTFGRDPIKYRQENAMKIGIVFGQRSQLRWDLPPMDTFLLNREIYKIPQAVFEERLAKLVKLLDAEEFLHQPVRTLSLGQRMKAEIIAALIHNPDLIILDEPTIGLDIVTKNSIVKFLNTLHDKTIIFTSHDLDEVEKVCSRVVILNKGVKVFDEGVKALEDTDAPTTIEFSSPDSFEKISQIIKNIQVVSKERYKVENIKKDDVKGILSLITQKINIEHIEVKRLKLEYLLEQIAKRGTIHES